MAEGTNQTGNYFVVCMCVYMGGPGGDIVHSSVALYLIVREPGAHHFGYTGCLVGLRDPPVSAAPMLGC